MANLIDVSWPYQVVQTSQDRSVPRPSVRRLDAELVGVDGTLRGGLRPAAGFEKVYELDFYGYTGGITHDGTSVVTDCFPVSFRRGNEDFGYGFVYRSIRPGGQVADIFLDFYDTEKQVWQTPSTCRMNLIGEGVNTTDDMDVVVFGRLVYVVIQGRSPILFYLDNDQTGAEPEELTSDSGTSSSSECEGDVKIVVLGRQDVSPLPGPGLQNLLTSPENAGPLGTVLSTGDSDRPGAGQVVLTNQTPKETGLLKELVDDTDNIFLPAGDTQGLFGVRDVTPLVSWSSESSARGVDAPATVANVPVRAGEILFAFVTGMSLGGASAPADASSIALTSTYESDTVTPQWLLSLTDPEGEFLKEDTDYSGIQDSKVKGKWFYATPAAGTYTVRAQSSTETVQVSLSVCVVQCADPTTQDTLIPYVKAGNLSNESGQWFHEVDNREEELMLVGFHAEKNKYPIEPHSITVPEDIGTNPDEFRFKVLSHDGTAMQAGFNGMLAEVNTLGVQTRSTSTGGSGFTYTATTTPAVERFFFWSRLHIGFAACPVTTNPTTNPTDPVFRGPTVANESTIAGTDTSQMISSGWTLAKNQSLLVAVAAVSGDDGDPGRDMSVFWGGTALQSIGQGDSEIFQTRVEYFWYVAPTDSTETVGWTDTRDVTIRFDSIQDAAEFYGHIMVVDGIDTANPLIGQVKIDYLTNDPRPTVFKDPPSNDEDQWIMCSTLSRGTTLTPYYLNNEQWSRTVGDSFFSGDTYQVNGDYTNREMGVDFGWPRHDSGTSSSSPSSLGPYRPESLAVAVIFRQGLPADAAEFRDEFQILLLTPKDEQENVGVDTSLTWDGRYIDGNPLPADLVYDVYFGVVGETDLLKVAEDVTEQEYDPTVHFAKSRLPFGKTFRWRIVARLTSLPYFDGVVSETRVFTTKGEFDARRIEAGDYVFGYVLLDSRTGRQSAFSEVAQAREEDFGDVEEMYAAIEVCYDSDKYDQAYIYRSVKTQDAGGTLIAGWQQLDKIVELRTYWTTNNGTGNLLEFDQPFRQSIYYYFREDKQLVYQPSFVDLPIYDAQMPRGGTALLYENTMLVGSVRGGDQSTPEEIRPADAVRGLGELRWSSMQTLSPELFPPENRYTPANPGNEIIKLSRVGGNVIGFSRDRMYHIRRELGLLQIREMHEGFLGLVNPKSVANAGSTLYVLTSKGIKMVDGFAKLDHMHALDQVIREDWRADLTQVSFAYDALVSVLFLLNPAQEEAQALWFDTAMLTSFNDMNFTEVRQGPWPLDPQDYDSELTNRALFLQNNPDSAEANGWKPKIFVLHRERNRTISSTSSANGQPRHTMLDPEGGDTRFAVTAVDIGPRTITLDLSGSLQVGTGLIGTKVYWISGVPIGQKATVTNVSGAVVTIDAVPTGAAIGDRVSFSPVYARWVGKNVGIETSAGALDYHRLKQINELIPSFTDVESFTYSGGETDAFYRGLVYTGAEETASTSAMPVDSSGSAVTSIVEIESQYPAAFGVSANYSRRTGVQGVSLSPGFEIFTSDVGYRVLSTLVRGKMHPTIFGEEPNVSIQ